MQGIEETAIKEWSEQLSGLSGDDIKRGLDGWLEDWPPSAPEFVKCCKGEGESWQHKSAAYKDYIPRDRQLTQKATPEVAEGSLAEMKKKLGM